MLRQNINLYSFKINNLESSSFVKQAKFIDTDDIVYGSVYQLRNTII